MPSCVSIYNHFLTIFSSFPNFTPIRIKITDAFFIFIYKHSQTILFSFLNIMPIRIKVTQISVFIFIYKHFQTNFSPFPNFASIKIEVTVMLLSSSLTNISELFSLYFRTLHPRRSIVRHQQLTLPARVSTCRARKKKSRHFFPYVVDLMHEVASDGGSVLSNLSAVGTKGTPGTIILSHRHHTMARALCRISMYVCQAF